MWTVSELFFFSHSASTSPIHHIKSGLCCIQIDLWFASKLYIHKYSPTHTQIYCFPLYLPLFPPLFCTLCLLLSFWFFLTLTNCIVTFRFFPLTRQSVMLLHSSLFSSYMKPELYDTLSQ